MPLSAVYKSGIVTAPQNYEYLDEGGTRMGAALFSIEYPRRLGLHRRLRHIRAKHHSSGHWNIQRRMSTSMDWIRHEVR